MASLDGRTPLRFGILSTANIARRVVPGIAAADRCEVVAVGPNAFGDRPLMATPTDPSGS